LASRPSSATFFRRDLAGERSKQSRLAVAHPAADQQVGPGPYRCAEKGPHQWRHGPQSDQIVERYIEQPVQPEKEMGGLGDPADREESGAVGELEVDTGVGRIEETLG